MLSGLTLLCILQPQVSVVFNMKYSESSTFSTSYCCCHDGANFFQQLPRNVPAATWSFGAHTTGAGEGKQTAPRPPPPLVQGRPTPLPASNDGAPHGGAPRRSSWPRRVPPCPPQSPSAAAPATDAGPHHPPRPPRAAPCRRCRRRRQGAPPPPPPRRTVPTGRRRRASRARAPRRAAP